jgi:uncharacterized membrane protein YhaH (DUF805 family)
VTIFGILFYPKIIQINFADYIIISTFMLTFLAFFTNLYKDIKNMNILKYMKKLTLFTTFLILLGSLFSFGFEISVGDKKLEDEALMSGLKIGLLYTAFICLFTMFMLYNMYETPQKSKSMRF